MKKLPLNDYGEIIGSLQQYEQACGVDDSRKRERLLQVVNKATQNELTPRQQQMVQMHFFEGRSMADVARTLGVNKSTVSRVIKAAQRRIAPCVRYFM